MKYRKFIIAIVLFFAYLSPSAAQELSEMPLPLDTAVRSGVLENGMTYYIRHNLEPKNRASFYIYQNVGSVLEEDHQNGLAHFLEHMAFNGTKHFPDKEILNTLERHGVAFGYHINAYTSQDETVYNLSEVPTNKPGLMDTCLLILHDWSNYLALTEEEIDLERGVIIEEWRTRRTANFRLYRESMPYLFNNSKYANRDVIGDLEVLKNFDYQVLRDFYHNWYRTDLQAIAVVGDFDPDIMEQKVIELFSKIPKVEDAPERAEIKIPDNDELIFAVVTDKEADQSEISIYIRDYDPEPGIMNAEQLREQYIASLFNRIVSLRISELLQKGDPPFVLGNIVRSSLKRNYDVTLISTVAKTNEEAKALRSILTEAERVKRHGVTQGELQRAKLHSLNRMENRVKEKDKISNDTYAGEYQSHFLGMNAYMDIETEYQIMQALYNTISIKDFTDRIPGWFGEKNNVMIISGPESDDISHLTKSEATKIIDDVKNSQVEPYVDQEVASSLVEGELESGRIIAEKEIPELDATEWTLSNGASVVYRFAEYEKDNIGFRAYSKGGASLYPVEYVPTMDMLPNLVPFYGIGDFDRTTLQKMLTGKTLELNLTLDNLSEGMRGSASPKDLETLMQMIYLRFTAPRFDEEAHQAIIARYIAYVENMNKNPQKIMNDSLQAILYDHHPRVRSMDKNYIGDIDLAKLEEVYRDRYKDASDFTFYFVGNISREELIPYVEKYIASIPSIEREENWIDLGINEPEGRIERAIAIPLSVPKSSIYLVFNSDVKYGPKNLVAARVLRGILDLRFTESIREEEGGTYGVMADASISHFPEEKGSIFIMFDTDPERADYLKKKVYDELEILAKKGPEVEDLTKTVENILKDREEAREHNSYWMNMLYNYKIHGYNYDAPENFEQIVREIESKDIRKLVKKLYKKGNLVDIIFYPLEDDTEDLSE